MAGAALQLARAALGAVPGLGAAVIDWLAYGHALKTEKDTGRFGEGDIRGVIASESSNNAKEGGALVPTLAFGVPGSASMAILLGAFMMHGLVPGPRMLTDNLEFTYSIIWSIALANVLGAGLCLAFSNQLARVATIRMGLLLPVVLAIIFLGAFQGSRQWGDLYVLLGFGVFGWIMKRQGWPRPPLILGVVLGDIVERYLFISVGRYEWAWMTRPLVVLLFALAVFGLLRPLLRNLRATVGKASGDKASGPHFRPRFSRSAFFTLLIAGVIVVSIASASQWNFEAGSCRSLLGIRRWLAPCSASVTKSFCVQKPPRVNRRGSPRPPRRPPQVNRQGSSTPPRRLTGNLRWTSEPTLSAPPFSLPGAGATSSSPSSLACSPRSSYSSRSVCASGAVRPWPAGYCWRSV